MSKQICNHGRWATNSNAVPTAPDTNIESRTHHLLPRQFTNMPFSNSRPRHANDLHNQTWWRSFVVTLVLCHIDGTPPRGPALESHLFMTKNSVGRFLRIAWTRSQSRRPAERTPMQENTLTTTSNDALTTTKIIQRHETQIGVMQNNYPIGRCADSTQRPKTEANLVAHIRTLQSGNLQDTCATNAGRFPSSRIHASRPKSWQSWHFGNPSNAGRINSHTNTLTYSRNKKAQTSESKIGELGIRTNFCTPNIAATTSRPPWSEANLVANILTVGVHTTMRLNAGRVPSTRIQVGRVNKQVCNHGRWATNSNAVSTATNRYIESRTHYSLPREPTDIPISSHQTRRANDLHNQALRLSHSDDHGPKPNLVAHILALS